MKSARFILLSLSLFPLACASTPHPEGKPLPALTFSYMQGIPVNVRHIEVVAPPAREPSGFVLSPGKTFQDYLNARFSAQGQRDILRAVVTEADVMSSRKSSGGRVRKFLEIDGHDVYQVNMTVRLEHVTDSGQVLYSRELKAARTMNITEHASVAAREQHQFRGMEQMLREMDARITAIVLNEMKLAIPNF
jgi:hypothetical protein